MGGLPDVEELAAMLGHGLDKLPTTLHWSSIGSFWVFSGEKMEKSMEGRSLMFVVDALEGKEWKGF